MKTIKRYSELILIPDFEERYKYLKLSARIGAETFGSHRHLNQDFYRSKLWRDFRHHIIVRDNGCDLAHKHYPIVGGDAIYIHHLNPLTIEEFMDDIYAAMDEENVVCTSFKTHQAIHYGTNDYEKTLVYEERKPNDTSPWKNGGGYGCATFR